MKRQCLTCGGIGEIMEESTSGKTRLSVCPGCQGCGFYEAPGTLKDVDDSLRETFRDISEMEYL